MFLELYVGQRGFGARPEDKKKKKYARLLIRAMFPDPKWLLTLGFLCILEEIRQS